ncbi:MAG: SUMF1/EgtB/PvdO family nonheme iron enzyme [Chloroflexi bacterium]|nr:SUMF1/EgtB/PvdO family nonheme iron enzyme [Chloroflexota bacterium]
MSSSPPDNTNFLKDFLDNIKDFPTVPRFILAALVLIAFLLVLGIVTAPDYLAPLLIVLVFVFALFLLVYQYAMKKLELTHTSAPDEPETPEEDPAPPAEPDPAELERLYLQDLFDRCAYLSVTSIDPRAKQSGAARLDLQSVFTELDVPARSELGEGRPNREALARPDETKREAVLTAVCREERLVILGKPGSGKSTLVNFVTLCLAGDALGRKDVNAARLARQGWTLPGLRPARVILRDYAARGLPEGMGLWAFIAAELELVPLADGGNLGVYAPILKRQLKEQGGILFLDGLDEVPDAHRRREQLKQAVADFTRQFPRVRLAVTTRPYAYDNPDWRLDGFASVYLLDFNEEQIETYIDRWYAATGQKDKDLGPARAEQYAEQLKREVKRNPSLQELAPRPLLLTLMVSLHRWRGGGALPQEREKLYDQSVDLLLDLWQRPKQIYDRQGRPVREETSALTELGIAPETLRRILSEVAYEAHKNQPDLTGTADIPGRQLAAALYDAPGRREDVSEQRIIRYVEERAGLLEDRGPDREGRRIYAFPHRTFQEYLAACHLLAQDTFPDELAGLARRDPERWREATLLAASRANSPVLVWGLVDALCLPGRAPAGLAAQGTKDDAPDWWGAFLAGAVLAETGLYANPAARNREKLERTRRWLTALVTQGALPPAERALAGQALGRLGDPRPEIMTVDGMPFCYVPGGPFWMGHEAGDDDEKPLHLNESVTYDYWLAQYPATNSQFAEFVAAGGYGRAEYWPEAKAAGYWRDGAFKGLWDSDFRDRPYNFGRPYNLPNHPMVGVSWYEALAFCRWLTERWRERLPAGYCIVLPSEAEWEKGARGGLQIPARPVYGDSAAFVTAQTAGGSLTENPEAQRPFPWLGEGVFANVKESGIGATSAPGCFPRSRSPLGCQDMSGNVWEWTRSLYRVLDLEKLERDAEVEWTSDWFGYPYAAGDGREDLTAGPEMTRVVRGGSWYSDTNLARCPRRGRYDPSDGFDGIGFRVAAAPCLPLFSGSSAL